VLPRPATYDDLLRVPDHLVAELIDGELYAWPRPASPHARASTMLGVRIGAAFDDGESGPGGWWIIDEPELHLGAHVVVPDLAGWRREKTPEFPNASGCEIAPDWLCEVISPSTGRVDRVKKLPIYAEHGVAHVWIIEPIQQTLEVFRLEGERWVIVATYGGDAIVRAEPFDAVELPLAKLWLTPPSPQS